MKRFVQTLLDNRALVAGLLVAYAVAGYLAFRSLPIEAYPDVTNVEAQVITLWPGHAAEEVEKFVTIPIENQLNGIPKRADLRSILPLRPVAGHSRFRRRRRQHRQPQRKSTSNSLR